MVILFLKLLGAATRIKKMQLAGDLDSVIESKKISAPKKKFCVS
mgnify:CR=1 FL=1